MSLSAPSAADLERLNELAGRRGSALNRAVRLKEVADLLVRAETSAKKVVETAIKRQEGETAEDIEAALEEAALAAENARLARARLAALEDDLFDTTLEGAITSALGDIETVSRTGNTSFAKGWTGWATAPGVVDDPAPLDPVIAAGRLTTEAPGTPFAEWERLTLTDMLEQGVREIETIPDVEP